MNTPPTIHITSDYDPETEPYDTIEVFYNGAKAYTISNDYDRVEGILTVRALVALARSGAIVLSATSAARMGYPPLRELLGDPEPEPEELPKLVELKFIPAPQGCEVYTLQVTCEGKTSSDHYEAEDTRRLDHDVVDNFIIAMKLGAIRLQADAQTCAFYPQLGYELNEGGN